MVLKSTPGLAGSPESCVSSFRCRCQTTPSVGAQIRPDAHTTNTNTHTSFGAWSPVHARARRIAKNLSLPNTTTKHLPGKWRVGQTRTGLGQLEARGPDTRSNEILSDGRNKLLLHVSTPSGSSLLALSDNLDSKLSPMGRTTPSPSLRSCTWSARYSFCCRPKLSLPFLPAGAGPRGRGARRDVAGRGRRVRCGMMSVGPRVMRRVCVRLAFVS